MFRKSIASLLVISSVLSCSRITPYGATPSDSQLAWQDLEYYMFCHFGPNTFTGREWGLGTENPDIFNPTALDCRQWASTAKAAGMKGIVITAKHHDGFCLWPSAYSTHTVAQSAWRNGKGDILAELRAACDEYGLLFGVYISPWDRNHPLYGTEAYNTVFASTIAEVHGKYGPVFEQWFDGANGGAEIPDYDWPLFNSTVYSFSPDAIIFSDIGPGCRWVGNERGYAGKTNWCRLDTTGFTPGAGGPPTDTLNRGNANGEAWIPAECDVPLRSGWFYSPANEGTQKSVEELIDIWLGSVGRGANLILNVAPDSRGLIPASDSTRLMEFKAAREAILSGEVGCASWKRPAYRSRITLKPSAPVSCIVIQEDIKYGQRIKAFTVEVCCPGEEWMEVASGTTIGHKRILVFDEAVEASRIRVRVTDSFAKPMLKSVELYGNQENDS